MSEELDKVANRVFKRAETISTSFEENLKALESPTDLITNYTKDDLISTGSTLLNLACSGMWEGGYYLGSEVHLLGDSGVGKTISALSVMAEAVIDTRFDKYGLKDVELEAAMHFNLEEIFGPQITRVEIIPDEEHKGLYTTVNWENDHKKWLKEGPHIIITDSWDALMLPDDLVIKKVKESDSDDEDSEENEEKEKKSGKGGWKTGKAILASEGLRKIIYQAGKTKSLIMILSQTRQNLKMGFGQPARTSSGGDALKFYATHEVWLYFGKQITTEVRKKKRRIGVHVHASVEKNKLTGKRRRVTFPVYDAYGIDDLQSMIDWMIEEKFWGSEKGRINTEGDLGVAKNYYDRDLIKYIEDENKENEFRQIIGQCWNDLENEIMEGINLRKPRYR